MAAIVKEGVEDEVEGIEGLGGNGWRKNVMGKREETREEEKSK